MDVQQRRATRVSVAVAAVALLVTVLVVAVAAWRLGVLFKPTE
jgi:hypothetical protein